MIGTDEARRRAATEMQAARGKAAAALTASQEAAARLRETVRRAQQGGAL